MENVRSHSLVQHRRLPELAVCVGAVEPAVAAALVPAAAVVQLEQALPVAADGLAVPELAGCTFGKCSNTTADTARHNSFDFHNLDIDSYISPILF